MLNLANGQLRKQIIEETKGDENIQRKKVSFNQQEVYKDRGFEQVKKYLEGFYSKQTIDNTPIVASVNLARRIVNKEASLYLKEPTRTFVGVTEEQAQLLDLVYQEMKINSIMQKLNQYYKLQLQSHCYITPKQGKLKASALMSHQIDAIPSSEDQEMGECYLINGFDRTTANVKVTDHGDSQNELIADEDDYKAGMNAIAWWSPLFNFTTDSQGNIISEEIDNPIGVVPVVDVNGGKDGEYWVRGGESITDFTIQYNGALTDLGNIVRMQGFGQAWLKAPQNVMPENIQIGPNYILKLPVDQNSGVSTDFGYSNASPDLAGSLAYLEGLLSSFLTSRGVDPKVVNAKFESAQYNSGLERLLAMIEQFEASEQDIATFKDAENKILKVVIAYLNTYGGSPILPKYPKTNISLDAEVNVQYVRPTAIQSDAEKLSNIQTRLELGLITKAEAIATDRDIPVEEAEKIEAQIEPPMQPQQSQPMENE